LPLEDFAHRACPAGSTDLISLRLPNRADRRTVGWVCPSCTGARWRAGQPFTWAH
jgi:hypothetical protein